MKVNAFWACRENHNFGDELTPYIIKHFTGEDPNFVTEGKRILLSGSMLRTADSETTVLGAGIGYADECFTGSPNFKIVRGHISKSLIENKGFNCEAIGDPALILPKILPRKRNQIHVVGIIPHYVDYNIDFGLLPKLDICSSVETVVDFVNNCEIILSSSLHGLIVANAYGINSYWVKFSNNLFGDDTKFYDYFSSIGIKQKFIDMRYKKLNYEELKLDKYKIKFDNNKLYDIIKNELLKWKYA